MRAKLPEIKKELRKRMHQPFPEQGRWLAQVVRGYLAYHAVSTNRATVTAFPSLCSTALAPHASAPQPERSLHVGADGAAGRRLAPLNLETSTPGQMCDLPSNTRGKNRMPELGPVRSGRRDLLDHRSSSSEQRRRYGDPEHLRCFHIDDKLVLKRPKANATSTTLRQLLLKSRRNPRHNDIRYFLSTHPTRTPHQLPRHAQMNRATFNEPEAIASLEPAIT